MQHTSRRTVVRGAVWAAPAVMVAGAAPAFAASPTPCTPTTMFDNLAVGTSPSTITFQPSGVTATLSYTSSGQGGDPTPGDTGKVAQTSTSPAWKYIELEMLRPDKGDYIDLTITLSQPVEGLSFVLHDIDSTAGAFRDTVIVSTSGFTATKGANIQGSGSSADPFRPIAVGDTAISSGLGDVRLTWAGSVSSVQLRYRAAVSGNSTNQHIGLGNLSYSACVDPSRSTTRRSATVTPTQVQVSQGEVVFVESDGTVDL